MIKILKLILAWRKSRKLRKGEIDRWAIILSIKNIR
jgi:hypothetical protein